MAEETHATSSPTPPPSATRDRTSPDETVDEKAADVTSQENTAAEAGEDPDVKEPSGTNGSGEAAAPKDHEHDIVDMEDAEKAADPAEAGSPEVPSNGTPASSKKASGSAKKKSSAVPEHKSKKVNKKKSRPLTNLNAEPGEYYFARMKGHPPWPAIICDEEMLPQSLLDTRPVTTKLPDGTYKKAEYADGGKRAYERTFPVMFLHTNEFAWMLNTDLTPLDSESVSKAAEKGKAKALSLAYEKAAEQNDLNYFKDMLVDHQKAIQEDQAAQAERDAKKLSKAKRKSLDATQATEGDSMDLDVDEDTPESRPKNKKRKKEIDSDGDEKPAKTPKTGTKLKLSTPKTPVSEPANKGKTAKAKTRSAQKASASGDEAVDTPKTEQTPLTPAAAKEMKEKKVLYFRHKLQRGFISRDTMPKEDEMKSMSDFLSELEAYPDLEGSIIRATKIHKVLKAMIKLPSIPLDEEYDFRSRSHELLAKWNDILSNDPNAGSAGPKAADHKPQAPAKTNGAVKGSKAANKAEVEDTASEEKAKEGSKKKIGTTVEGEEEADRAAEADAEKGVEIDTDNEKSDKEVKTDEPNIDSAPAQAYIPPTVDADTSD